MTGEERIRAERDRQIQVENYGGTHDDAHDRGQLYLAAKAYLAATHRTDIDDILEYEWPWEARFFKPYLPHSTVRGGVVDTEKCLIKAGALILAEKERLDRVLEIVQTQLDRNFPPTEEAPAVVFPAAGTPVAVQPSKNIDEEIPF